MEYWREKGCLITGGTAGLGLSIARQLARRGARLLINGRDPVRLDQATHELRTLGGEVHGLQGDISSPAVAQSLVAQGIELWGAIDFVCHAAGRSMRSRVLETTPEEFESLWRLNTLAAFEVSRQVAHHLAQRKGHLVLIGSLASRVAPRYLGAYPTSKFPLVALAQQLRLEVGPEGLHTLLVCPGPIRRGDSPFRYQQVASGEVPAEAQRPGGGAKVSELDPDFVAERILLACQRRKSELVLPAKARWLFVVSQISPNWGDWLLRKMTS